MKKVALDIDDVLAKFYPGFCKFMKFPEKRVDIWDADIDCKWVVDNFDKIRENVGFWYNLEKLSNQESINFEIDCYLTSSPKKILPIRELWLLDKGFPQRPVIHTHDKLAMMYQRNIDILVDDKPSVIDIVNKNGRIGLQFKPHYMTEEINDKNRIIHHLSEIKKWSEL